MTTIKPQVTPEQAMAIAQQHFVTPISQLDPLQGGEIAQIFSFVADNQRYVLRFNRHMGANFAKEYALSRTIGSARIPVPRVLHIGRLGTLHYAISQHYPGVRIDYRSPEEYATLIPQLMETLDAIHAVDISQTAGYGTFNDDGVGSSPSWRKWLTQVYQEEPEWEFYGRWHDMFETTFLERDVFEQLYHRMENLLDACPEERYLVHGNFGFGNLLVYEGQITAVLDWIDAKYGDFVYDIAWLTFWSPWSNIADLYQDHYAQQGKDVPRYRDRLLCYLTYIGLDALRFYAKAERQDSYCLARDRVLSFQN